MGDPSAADPYATVDEAVPTAQDTVPESASPAVVVVSGELRADPAPPLLHADELPRGAAIGRYLVLSRLGAGGMGVVYAAYDPDLDRKVAIKLLRPWQKKSQVNTSGRMRLLREAQALARLSHPNVTAVYDVGTAYSQVFVAMEFIDGCTLREWLHEKPRSLSEILGIFRRAGRGLLAAHTAGMIHRDFKPDNVLVSRDGQVRVSDFGLARALQDPKESQENKVTAPKPASEPPPSESRGASSEPALLVPITQVGEFIGTPRYMAPEQFRGDHTDQRTDVFSFCVALWESVYGTHPFGEGDVQELCLAVTLGKLARVPAERKVPAWLHRLLLRGLAPEPPDRYQSMQELLQELSRDRWKTRLRLAAGALAGLVLLLGGWGVRALLLRNEVRCQGAAQRLAQVWNEGTRSLLRGALLATGHPQAEATAQRVLTELDRYAAQWAAMRIEACTATHVRGEQSAALLDLRMQCLDRRLQEVAALTQELRAVDRLTIERVVSARYDFTPTAVCADVQALSRPVPLPERPEVRARVEELYGELAILKAQDFSGRYTQMAPRARTALATAHAIGYGPAEAQAAFVLGKVEFRNGDIAGAERDFERAAALALRSRTSGVLAQALTLIHYIVGITHQKYDQAEVWRELASAASAGGAEAERSRPQLLSDSCVVATRQKQYAEAVPLCQQAIALQQQLTGQDSPEAAAYRNNLASAYRHSGQSEAALAEYQRALTTLVQHSGRQHPLATMTLRNWASLLYDNGQFREAAVRYGEALSLVEQRFGAEDPRLLDSLATVVMAELQLRNLPQARASAERMLLIAAKTFGDQHAKVAVARDTLAKVLYAQGRIEEALAQYERSRAVHEQAKDEEALAENLVGAAGCLRALGRAGESLPLLERAIALIKPGMGDLLSPDAQFALAQSLWALNKRKLRSRALEAARLAQTGYAQAQAPGRELRAVVTQWLAQHGTED
jgi:tetratricopeptide (TPR) repeat protein/predicted Ser/Thr protein kinase